MTFRFKFIGRQSRAIGITYQIFDSYKAEDLGHALFMLYSDYELITNLHVFDTTGHGITDSFPHLEIDVATVKATKIIEHNYPRRETSPNTGIYRYYRADAPENYKW